MHYSLSPLDMFMNAGPVSRMVMAVLIVASMWTWVLIIDGVFVALKIFRALGTARMGGPVDVLWPIARARREALKVVLPNESEYERRDRVFKYTNRAASDLMSDARAGLASLAIVSSVGPFVGLFGTVWGIMSSFAGIAQTQDTSLAVVAPGIAESLAATAYGLAAAIPASIGYNRLRATFAKLNDELAHYVAEDATRSSSFQELIGHGSTR